MNYNKYKLIHYDTITSTNSYLKENYNKIDEFTVISCDFQTEGKGRSGHIWLSDKSENIMMSILLKSNIDISNIGLLPLMTGVAVYNVIQKYITKDNQDNIDISIKWPNDILINNHKIAGILLESIITESVEALIIGIGINVNQIKFSEDLINKATSLTKEFNHSFDIKILKKQMIEEFDNLYNMFIENNFNFLEVCRQNNYLLHKTITYKNNEYIVIDINDLGCLVLKSETEVIEINSGEITLSNMYNN